MMETNDMNDYNYLITTPSGRLKQKPITLSTKLILQEAKELGIKWETISDTEIIKLSYNGQDKYFRHQISPLNSNLAFYSCDNKEVTKSLLSKANINVAQGFFITQKDSEKYYTQVYKKLNKPLVVKPLQGMHGDFVTVNISTLEDFKKIVKNVLEQIKDSDQGILAEEMFDGIEYRIAVTREKVLGVTKRVPANVTGDSVSTIKQLIEKKNLDPRREDDFYNTGLKKIPINDKTIRDLSEQDLTLESILEDNQYVAVRLNSNLSTGGDSVDVTDKIHNHIREIALRAINAIPGLEFAGLDLMCRDITTEQSDDSYIIVEINNSPGIFMHDKPFIGENRHIAREFLFLIFPELKK